MIAPTSERQNADLHGAIQMEYGPRFRTHTQGLSSLFEYVFSNALGLFEILRNDEPASQATLISTHKALTELAAASKAYHTQRLRHRHLLETMPASTAACMRERPPLAPTPRRPPPHPASADAAWLDQCDLDLLGDESEKEEIICLADLL